ncbi:MAG: TonB family protein [Taibaiella sp.]|nr:TonB family protein [Taibaiella sp.]
MRYFGLAFVILFSISCSAQKKSRIVFFRMDVPIGPESSAFKEVRNFSDELKRNEETIASLRSPSVYIYETDSLTGSYYLAAKPGRNPDVQKAELKGEPGSITFVRISIGDVEEATCHAEILDVAEFHDYYDNAMWLRKKLSAKGFKSVEQLTKGYELMPLKPMGSEHFNLYVKIRRSLTDTAFLGVFDIPVKRDSARIFSVATEDPDGQILVTNYFAKTGKIESKCHYLSLDSESKTGHYEEYFESGNLESSGTCKNNKRDGHWEYYYDTATKALWYECTYKEGYEEGVLKSYYPSGKLKREEFHHCFIDTVEYGPRKARKTYVKRTDSIMSGKRFDESGQPITFTPFEIMSKPSYDLNAFLAKNIKYPDSARENDIEGRVMLRFLIDKKGEMHDLTIMQGVSADINREAIKAVHALPPWNAAIRDDEPVSVIFTLPIQFRLE